MGNCSGCVHMKTQTQITFEEEDRNDTKSKGVYILENSRIDEDNQNIFLYGMVFTAKNLNHIIFIQRIFRKYMKRIHLDNSDKLDKIYLEKSKLHKTITNSITNQPIRNKIINKDDHPNNSCIIFKYHSNEKFEEETNQKILNDQNIVFIDDSFEKKKIKTTERKSMMNSTKMLKNKYKEDKNKIQTVLKKIKLPNGSVFIGNSLDNQAHGFGSLIYSNGDIYCGDWNNNQANGLGKYINSNGSRYYGCWLNNNRHGYGIEIWPNGGIYEGEFLDGNKNSIGILKLEDNSYFEGEFFNNNMIGLGTFNFKDKRIFYGEWKNNKMNGFGILTWPDGKRFEGSFENDKKHGFGIFYSGNKIYIGCWNNSKLDGDILIIQNGRITKSFWMMGKKIKSLPDICFHPYDKLAEGILDSLEFNEISR